MKHRRTWVLLGLVIVVAWIGCFALELLGAAGAFRSIHPHFMGSCREVRGPVGAEDMELDRESGVVYITSDDRRASVAGHPVPGAIYAYRLEAGSLPQKVPMDFRGQLHPHGMSLWRHGDELRIFVVQHATMNESSVEIFAVEPGPRLRHLRSVSGPEIISANDVAAVGPEQFYVTNDAGTKPQDLLRVAETYFRRPWASVVFFDGTALTRVADGLTYANGVVLSHDGRRVYISESTGRSLRIYGRDRRDNSLTQMKRIMFSSALDNITLDRDGALWIGAHPQMLAFLAHAANPEALSPSQVLRVRIDDRGEAEVDEITMSDGSDLSGSSVAVPIGNRLLVGSVFEPYILDCYMLPSNAR